MNEDTEIGFQLQTGYLGYRTKEDETNMAEALGADSYLVSGSKNVLINSSKDKVVSRPGYALFGAESEERTPPKSEDTWLNSTGEEILLRETDGTLEFYSEESEAFEELMTGLSDTFPVRFTKVWNGTELLDELLFVNHDPNLYEWSGGMGTLAVGGVAAGTITINEVIAESRFLLNGTRSIRIKDDGGTWRETVYTGQSGSQFTVSTDLSGFSFSGGNLVVQVVRTNANAIAAGYTLDTIRVLANQVYLGSHSSRDHYVSKNTSFTDYSFSSPRVPGEGAKMTLDDVNTAFEIGRDENGVETMVVFCGQDFAYRTEFEIASGSTSDREILKVKPLIAAPKQGARSQELVGKTKNDIVFVNWENELNALSQVENLAAQVSVPVSDPIKPDFLAANFDQGGHIRFSKNNLYIAVKADSVLFVLDLENKYWQPPQYIPVGLFSTYGDELLGHSSTVKETYTLFTGTSDRSLPDDDESGQPFTAIARFAYRHFGGREVIKNHDRYYHELYMTRNLTLTHISRYDYGGARGLVTKEMVGTDTDFISEPDVNASLGVHSLGVPPLGRAPEQIADLVKYRRFRTHQPIDYFEYQSEYQADIQDSQFQIVAHGPNARVSNNLPAKITK